MKAPFISKNRTAVICEKGKVVFLLGEGDNPEKTLDATTRWIAYKDEALGKIEIMQGRCRFLEAVFAIIAIILFIIAPILQSVILVGAIFLVLAISVFVFEEVSWRRRYGIIDEKSRELREMIPRANDISNIRKPKDFYLYNFLDRDLTNVLIAAVKESNEKIFQKVDEEVLARLELVEEAEIKERVEEILNQKSPALRTKAPADPIPKMVKTVNLEEFLAAGEQPN